MNNFWNMYNLVYILMYPRLTENQNKGRPEFTSEPSTHDKH